jgi:hypothetical protein
LISITPLVLFIYFCLFIKSAAGGEAFVFSYPWVPSLQIHLNFYLHGLTLQLLFSGITFAFGMLAYFRRDILQQAFSRFAFGKKWGPKDSMSWP